MKKLLLLGLTSCLFSFAGRAQCMLSPVPLTQRLNQSALVIEGKVAQQQSFWNPQHTMIYTANQVSVYKVFKGNLTATNVEVITEGGQVGAMIIKAEPSLELRVGDVGVFTLNSSSLPSQFGAASYLPYAGPQGFIRYDLSNNTAHEPFQQYTSISSNLYVLLQQLSNQAFVAVGSFTLPSLNNGLSVQSTAAVTSFSPSTITAGTVSTLTITGTGFGATQSTSYVSFKNADDGGSTYIQPAPSQYVSWSNTQIVVQVPTSTNISGTAGTGNIQVTVAGTPTVSTQTLTVTYGHLNVANSGTVYNTRHVNKSSGGYVWQMNTGFDSNASAKASFLRAFQSWRCATYINWSLGATTTTSVTTNDGVNVIRFDIGNELSAGVLGVCYSYWSGCSSGFYVSELDIVFDDATNWQYGPSAPGSSQYDFESVAVHELGHGHQLSHVINSLDLMHYALANGQQKRSLNTDDLNGGNAVMARNLSGTICSQSMMTALTASNCALGSPSADFAASKTVICAGQSISFSDQSIGNPTSWAWTFQGASPATSTLQTPTGITYASPGTYSVSLTASNSNGSSVANKIAYIQVTNPASLPLSESFQGSFVPTNWYLGDGGSDGVNWQLSTTAGQAGSTQSAIFDNFDNDTQGKIDELKTYVNLSGYTSAKMIFYRAYAAFSPPYSDTLDIAVSTNCGSTQTVAWTKGGATLSTTVATSSSAIFVPSSTQWAKDSVILTPYVGQSNVMISFRNHGHYGNGLYIDNINITGVGVAAPTASFTVASPVCSGQAIALTDASTGSPTTWTWTATGATPASANTQSTSITYTAAGTYSITLNAGNGGGTSSITKTITVVATPSLSATGTMTLCSGQSTTLNASGATSYTWNPGAITTSSFVTIPSSTVTYTLTGANGACVSTKLVTVSVTPQPVLSANSASICAGGTASLSASGATSYTWNPGALTTTSVNVNPGTTTVYTLTGLSSGCTATKTVTVNVTPIPVLSVNAPTVCMGSAATLSVSGATNYTWTPGGNMASSFTVSPGSSTGYTVTGATNGCGSAASTTVTVNPNPSITVPGASICAGQTATLSASGATSYTWMPGGTTTASIAVMPTTTTQYTVSGSSLGCSTTTTVNVAVTAMPVLAIGSATTCAGGTATLTVSGATSYTWTPGGNTAATFTDSPSATSVYTITGANGACTSTGTATITIAANLSLVATGTTICAGQSASLSVSGASTYTWNPGPLTGAVVTVTPSTTTTYTVDGTSGGCMGSTLVTVAVDPLPPTPSISNTGYTLSCTPTANQYQWYINGAPIANATNPTYVAIQDGVYSLITTNSAGCQSLLSNTLAVIGTGIETIGQSGAYLNILPNPNTGSFSLQTSLKGACDLQVYDAMGQLVYQQNLQNANETIHVEQLGKGVYYLCLVQASQRQTLKMLIQ